MSEQMIAGAMAEHRWTNRSRCACGWTVRPCIFPEPQVSGLTQFEAHVASAIAEALGLLTPKCGCYACVGNVPAPMSFSGLTIGMTRMIVCSECGNKRCPHGTDHRNECTGSNEPEQPGSRYGGLELAPMRDPAATRTSEPGAGKARLEESHE